MQFVPAISCLKLLLEIVVQNMKSVLKNTLMTHDLYCYIPDTHIQIIKCKFFLDGLKFLESVFTRKQHYSTIHDVTVTIVVFTQYRRHGAVWLVKMLKRVFTENGNTCNSMKRSSFNIRTSVRSIFTSNCLRV